MFRRGKNKHGHAVAEGAPEFADPLIAWDVSFHELGSAIGLSGGGGDAFVQANKLAQLLRPAVLQKAVVEFLDRERSTDEETASRFAGQLVSQEVLDASEAAFWHVRFESFATRTDLQEADPDKKKAQSDQERHVTAITNGVDRVTDFVLSVYQEELKQPEVGDPLLVQFDTWQSSQPSEL